MHFLKEDLFLAFLYMGFKQVFHGLGGPSVSGIMTIFLLYEKHLVRYVFSEFTHMYAILHVCLQLGL